MASPVTSMGVTTSKTVISNDQHENILIHVLEWFGEDKADSTNRGRLFRLLTENEYDNIPAIVTLNDEDSEDLKYVDFKGQKPTKVTVRKGERGMLRQLKLFQQHIRTSRASFNIMSYLSLSREDFNKFCMDFSPTMLGLNTQLPSSLDR